MLARWPALMRAFDDGRLALDNNAAERALRCVAVGRKNYLFAGSELGAERAAAFYTLIETAKMNGLDPEVSNGIGTGPLIGVQSGPLVEHARRPCSARRSGSGWRSRAEQGARMSRAQAALTPGS